MCTEYSDVWFCEDCTIAEVNGDYSGMSDERAKEVSDAFDALSIEPGFSHLSANWDSETNEGINEFSWRPCWLCRSPLGGSRHRFAFWYHAS